MTAQQTLKIVRFDSPEAKTVGTMILMPGENVLIETLIDKLKQQNNYHEVEKLITIEDFRTESVNKRKSKAE